MSKRFYFNNFKDLFVHFYGTVVYQTLNMLTIVIDKVLLEKMHEQAVGNTRKRINLDLRTSVNDGSQRLLNVLEPGTKVSIHRHPQTAETLICLAGKLDVVFYDLLPNEDCGGPFLGELGNVVESGLECNVFEVGRTQLCPNEGNFGVQIPKNTWHTIVVYEPSAVFDAKDGAYAPLK